MADPHPEVRAPRAAQGQLIAAPGMARVRCAQRAVFTAGTSVGLAAGLAAALALGGCTPVVRYADALIEGRDGRTWFTRAPATIAGGAGFVLGIPIDVLTLVPAWFVYRAQPETQRDPVSVFLFPSFVLWKAGTLLGAPFDAVEWLVWRAWQEPPPLTQQERDAIEQEWDSRESFSEYPVTPIHPLPPAPRTPSPDG